MLDPCAPAHHGVGDPLQNSAGVAQDGVLNTCEESNLRRLPQTPVIPDALQRFGAAALIRDLPSAGGLRLDEGAAR
jgi:hypothetical protein